MVNKKFCLFCGIIILFCSIGLAIEIPLKPAEFRPQLVIGFVDMQKVFYEYSETNLAKDKVKREIEKLKSDLESRKLEITLVEGEVDGLSKKVADLDNKTTELQQKYEKTKEEIINQIKQQQVNSTAQQQVDISSSSVDTSSGAVPAPSVPQSSSEKKYEIEVTTSNNPQLKEAFDQVELFRKELDNLKNKKKEQGTILKQKNDELNKQTQNYEDTLAKMEDRKTQEILGKIYDTLIIVAKEEELDLIMDKNYILFGEKGVDITEKLLKRLKESQ